MNIFKARALLEEALTHLEQPTQELAPSPIIDRRAFAVPTGPRTPQLRDWSQVRGITLHQTACYMGEREERYNGINVHYVVTRGGKSLWVHDENKILWHGHGWNNQCVGIEIDGLYEGVLGRPETLWDDPSTPAREIGQRVTPESVVAAKNVIRTIYDNVRKAGGNIQVLNAHRQSSKDRRNDPGSEIWQLIALPLLQELSLTDGGTGFQIGGYPIPEEWDPAKKGIKY